jgi:hypothetical protein
VALITEEMSAAFLPAGNPALAVGSMVALVVVSVGAAVSMAAVEDMAAVAVDTGDRPYS